jgi:hypothetical protein
MARIIIAGQKYFARLIAPHDVADHLVLRTPAAEEALGPAAATREKTK